MPIATSRPCLFGSCSPKPVSLPALGPRPLAAVTSKHIASPTETAIPQGSLPGRDEPDQSESPGGTADLHAAAGVRCGGESSPWESVPFGRRRPPWHTLPGLRAKAPVEPSLNRDPPCPLPGRDKPDRSEDPEGPRITRCGGSPLAARQRTGRDKPDRSRSQGVRRGDVLALGECAVRAAGVPPWHTLPGLRGTTAIPQTLSPDGTSPPVQRVWRNRGLDAAAEEPTAARLRARTGQARPVTQPGVRRGTPRSPGSSARTGQARPVRGPGWTADLHAAAGVAAAGSRLPVRLTARDVPVRSATPDSRRRQPLLVAKGSPGGGCPRTPAPDASRGRRTRPPSSAAKTPVRGGLPWPPSPAGERAGLAAVGPRSPFGGPVPNARGPGPGHCGSPPDPPGLFSLFAAACRSRPPSTWRPSRLRRNAAVGTPGPLRRRVAYRFCRPRACAVAGPRIRPSAGLPRGAGPGAEYRRCRPGSRDHGGVSRGYSPAQLGCPSPMQHGAWSPRALPVCGGSVLFLWARSSKAPRCGGLRVHRPGPVGA